MKEEKYMIPEIESIDIVGEGTLCQSSASLGGSTSDYGQDGEFIF